ncbi:MAG: 3-deoxy-D-manno-octulosonic acid transferase [Alphaproteobacteria bacterium]
MAASIILCVYNIITVALSLFVPNYLKRRVLKGKEDPKRLEERYGIASVNRPQGKLVWMHAASVGETRSAVSLIHALIEEGFNVVLTTGTMTAAAIAEKTLAPIGVIHQYLPMDTRKWAGRFLDHWQPDHVMWVEQELWPNLLYEVHCRNIPLTLINGRISEGSFKNWWYARFLLRHIMRFFTVRFAQSKSDATRFEQLTSLPFHQVGNLKLTTPPLEYDHKIAEDLASSIKGRPVWLAASTHPGEEELILHAHQEILSDHPNALLIVIPRHPNRGNDVADLAKQHTLSASLRTRTPRPADSDQVYVADTLGETGLFYAVCNLVFMGGSLVPVGGHNPVEPAQFGCQLIYGPHDNNFRDLLLELSEHHPINKISNSSELIQILRSKVSVSSEFKHDLVKNISANHNKNIIIKKILTFVNNL